MQEVHLFLKHSSGFDTKTPTLDSDEEYRVAKNANEAMSLSNKTNQPKKLLLPHIHLSNG